MPAEPEVRRVVPDDGPALRALRLEVHEDNGPARSACARRGFVQTGCDGRTLDLGGAVAATIGYRRGLLRGAPP